MTSTAYMKVKAKTSQDENGIHTAQHNEKINVQGNKGSLLQVLIAALQNNVQHKQLIIAEDQEEAAYIYNDLQNILFTKMEEFKPKFYQISNKRYKVEIVYQYYIDMSNSLKRIEPLMKKRDNDELSEKEGFILSSEFKRMIEIQKRSPFRQ